MTQLLWLNTPAEYHTSTLVMYFCKVCWRGGTGSLGRDAWFRYICPGLYFSFHSGGSWGNWTSPLTWLCAPRLWRWEDASTLGEDLDITEQSTWGTYEIYHWNYYFTCIGGFILRPLVLVVGALGMIGTKHLGTCDAWYWNYRGSIPLVY